MVGHAEDHRTKIGKVQYRNWDRSMNRLTDSLQGDNGNYYFQTEEHVLHILCKHHSNEVHHDTKWKYRKQTEFESRRYG
eukprot:7467263-Heterocapsa_arctica.AAC.1